MGVGSERPKVNVILALAKPCGVMTKKRVRFDWHARFSHESPTKKYEMKTRKRAQSVERGAIRIC